MRFHFENVGPIRSADLELGDLTLVAGRNNTGKTYIVYTMYGFLRMFPDMLARGMRPGTKSFEAMSGEARGLLEGTVGASVIFDYDDIKRFRQRWLRDAALTFSRGGLAQVFSTPRGEFAKAMLGVAAPELPRDLRYTAQAGPFELGITGKMGKVRVELLAVRQHPPGRIRPQVRRSALPQLLGTVAFPGPDRTLHLVGGALWDLLVLQGAGLHEEPTR